MIKNYLRIAYRSAVKNRVITIINIVGLALGVAACLLITTYIIHETSYDSSIPDRDNIYRLYNMAEFDGELRKGAHFSANMARTAFADFDEVIESGRFMDNELFYGAGENDIRFASEQMQHRESGFTYADQSLLSLLQLPMVYGDVASALSEPRSMIISERKAEKYFAGANPIGEVMYLNGNDDEPFTISGVMKNFPTNSHLDYDFMITLTDVEFGEGEQTRWTQNNYFTYVKLKPGTDAEALSERMTKHVFGTYLVPAMRDAGMALADRLEDIASIELQAIGQIHLHSQGIMDTRTRGDIRFIWLFGIIAVLILLIACTNFINLSTARSANRAKEVGLRKVLGSKRPQLVRQFLTESMLVTFIAFALGAVLSQVMLPFFNKMAGKSVDLPFTDPLFVPIFAASALVIGCIAGAYPSLYLSRFSPIAVLKGRLGQGSKSSGLRSSLVVFQFATSIVLIASTLIVNKQFNYILDEELGFDRTHVIQVHSSNVLGDQVTTFRDEVRNLPNVVDASISDYLPIDDTKRNGNTFNNEGRSGMDRGVPGQAWIVDQNYLSTLNINLVEGRNFPTEIPEDKNYVLVNQEMARQLGLENPIGKNLERGRRLDEIIGVVEDFHFDLLTQKVRPLALFPGISSTMTSIKISGNNIPETIASIEGTWNAFSPTLNFEYTFMDESFASMYEHVSQVRTIFTGFSILAICIACLGLFALSAFIVEQRQKEMSIRKVLGASLHNIFGLLTRQFIVLIFLALIIAVPVAIHFMSKWLQDYEYAINISWDIFALSASVALALTLLTISYHALRTVFSNPMESLRDE